MGRPRFNPPRSASPTCNPRKSDLYCQELASSIVCCYDVVSMNDAAAWAYVHPENVITAENGASRLMLSAAHRLLSCGWGPRGMSLRGEGGGRVWLQKQGGRLAEGSVLCKCGPSYHGIGNGMVCDNAFATVQSHRCLCHQTLQLTPTPTPTPSPSSTPILTPDPYTFSAEKGMDDLAGQRAPTCLHP